LSPVLGLETVVEPGFGLAEAWPGEAGEWTPARESALAELTPVPARLGEGNSAELLLDLSVGALSPAEAA
jgi:hypothetical protein